MKWNRKTIDCDDKWRPSCKTKWMHRLISITLGDLMKKDNLVVGLMLWLSDSKPLGVLWEWSRLAPPEREAKDMACKHIERAWPAVMPAHSWQEISNM